MGEYTRNRVTIFYKASLFVINRFYRFLHDRRNK